MINEGIYDDSGEDANLGVRLALSALRQVEVLVELFSIDYAKRGRLGSRYDLLLVTETLKYVRCFFHPDDRSIKIISLIDICH